MKKFILSLTILFSTEVSFAGWTESFWFEPTLLCAAGAAAGYTMTATGQQPATNAAIGCAALGLVSYTINSYYEDKFTKNAQKELQTLREQAAMYERILANKAANGEAGKYSELVQEYVKPEVLPDGSVRSGYIKESLRTPNQNLEVGY
nr:hypothetical protein BdHM001_35910 [Bdellovibrio sp. HM001]